MAKGGKKGGGNGGGTDTPLHLVGTAGADRLNGGSLDDRFEGLGGDDQIKGGAGTDTAVYSGDIGGYEITFGRRGSVVVTDIDPSDGDDGTDTLYSVEVLEFANYTYSTTGPNNQPVVEAPDNVTVTENETTTYTFTVTAMNGDDPRGYLTGDQYLIGGLTESTPSADGSERTLTYEINGDYIGGNVNTLAAGETIDKTIQLVAGTLYGGYVYEQDVTFTIVGVNDAPTMADGTLAVTEDGGPKSIDLSQLGADIDSDDDGTSLSYRIVAAPDGFAAWIDGNQLFFDPGDAFQELERTDSAFLTLTVEAVDRHGAVSNVATVTVQVQGENDPLPDYLNTDGSINYSAIGVTVPTLNHGTINGFAGDQWLLDFVQGTPQDDVRLARAEQVLSLDDNTFFDHPDTTVQLGDGNDVLGFLLDGQNAAIGGFSGVYMYTGAGNDVVVLDATAAQESFYINVTDIWTGDGSDQVLIDLATEANGWIDDFRSALDIHTGRDNDLVSIRRIDSNGGDNAILQGRIDLESGDDELMIEHAVQNVLNGYLDFSIELGHGNDTATIDTSGTTGSGPDARTGLYGLVGMGDGDDILHLNLANPVEDDARATIFAGDHPYYREDVDKLYLDMATVDDFTVTRIVNEYSTPRWTVEWQGQTLDLYGWEEVFASDGLLIDGYW